MIKISDYLFQSLCNDYGVKHVFMISGGGNMHLVDSLGRNKKLKYVCNHHEQACAMAAECYSRVTGNLGVCLVTTGPGATNAITGVLGAWLDSIPMLVISGQVKQESQAHQKGLRQLGDQETDIISIISPITKYAVMIKDPTDIKYQLQKALYLAKSGRPGPVWLDVPLDIQGALVEESNLKGFKNLIGEEKSIELEDQVTQVLEKLKSAKRPVLLAGNGIRLSGAQKDLTELIAKMGIPTLSSFAGFDLVDSTNPYYFGRICTVGHRAANFIVQNSDLLISVGSRLNLRVVTFNWVAFAREAYKVVVDIDPAELNKKTISPDLPISVDAGDFIREMLRQLNKRPNNKKSEWLDYCKRMVKKYPVVLQQQREQKTYVHSHVFTEKLSELLDKNAIVVTGDGLACESVYRALKIKDGQRVIMNSGCAAMGYDLPAAVGASFARDKGQVICVTGDGSSMLNIHELQTIIHHNLPIKIFLFENQGYLSIRRTQDTHFKQFHVGSDTQSGVSCPDFLKMAKALGFETEEMKNNNELEEKIKKVLGLKGPVFCVIRIDPNEQLIPKLASRLLPDGKMVSPPLEDMFPFLDREEFKSNMIIPPLKESQ